MRNPVRLAFVCSVALLFIFAGPGSYAQDATTAGSSASYDRRPPVDATTVQLFTPNTVLVLPGDTSGAASTSGGLLNLSSTTNASTTGPNGNIAGLDSVVTFDGAYFSQAGPDSSGIKLWRFSMIGNDPLQGGTTVIPAKASEVSLQLLNADGSVFKVVPFAPFEDLTEDSPNFMNASYSSSPTKTQFADAVQRAEFFNLMKPGWHTRLSEPNIVNRVTVTVPRFVNVRLSNGNIIQARSYFTGTAADGSTFVLMLNLLFNFFFDNEFVSEINAGNFTTDAVNMALFPNTFLYSLNVNNPNTPGGCCVLGFHTFFFQPGAIPQPRWVSLYASWISPGLFGAGFQDVTGLSHEISESFNDPFLDNATSKWQFPGVPANAKVCQANFETGDPVEVLATATVPLFIKERKEMFTYHPQTEALLQWFEMGKTSNAIPNTAGTDGAYSYPDDTALPHSALPCPQ
jgi:hypothetical protein